uniref:MFS domain-containing protein n=1 Tax=Heterorhabditis bacteriophora TaxID=37862 RepID=A0A1I7XP98_HETBA
MCKTELAVKEGLLTPKHMDDFVVLGKYSILVCIMTEIAMLSQLSNTMYMVYAGAAPTIKGCGNLTFSSQEEGCANIHLCGSSEINVHRQFYSINEEWVLYCEDDALVRRSTSMQMFGVMLGSLSMGQISDSFGRKWPSFISLLMMTLLGFASYFCNDLTQFTIIRTIQGVFLGAQSTVSVVYMVENIPKKSRMWISTTISYSPNVLLLGVIAYFFQEWRTLASVVSALTIPALVLILSLNHFACVTVNYANMFNLGSLSGSIYLNSILIGSFRYITNLICGLLDLKLIWFGRKVVIVDSVAANELFPTSVRTLCYSFVQLFSRFGIIIAPYIFTWAETWYLLPYVFLLTIAVLDLILFPYNCSIANLLLQPYSGIASGIEAQTYGKPHHPKEYEYRDRIQINYY